MCRRINPTRQPAYDREACPSQTARQPFGLRESIMRGMPRSDNRHRELVLRLRLPTPKQHARRIMDLAKWPWIVAARLSEHIDPMLRRKLKLAFSINFVARRHDLRGCLRPNSVDTLQLAPTRRQDGRRRPKPLEQRFSQQRPDARNKRQPHIIDKLIREKSLRHAHPYVGAQFITCRTEEKRPNKFSRGSLKRQDYH